MGKIYKYKTNTQERMTEYYNAAMKYWPSIVSFFRGRGGQYINKTTIKCKLWQWYLNILRSDALQILYFYDSIVQKCNIMENKFIILPMTGTHK